MQTFHLTDWRNIPTPDLTRGERGLLKTLIMLSFNKERVARPSQQFLADEQGCSVRQIRKDLQSLIALKYIIHVGYGAKKVVLYLINWARLVPKTLINKELESYPQANERQEPQFLYRVNPRGTTVPTQSGTTVPHYEEPQFLQDKEVKYEIKEKHVLEFSKTQTLTPQQVQHLKDLAKGDTRYAHIGEQPIDFQNRVIEAKRQLKQLEKK